MEVVTLGWLAAADARRYAEFQPRHEYFYGAINYEFNLSNETLNAWTYDLTKRLFVVGGVGRHS